MSVKSENLVLMHQTHSNKVIEIKKMNYRRKIYADAMITKMKGVSLGVLTADCVPIILYDSRNKIIGCIHAGWKGAFKNIIKNTIHKIKKISVNSKIYASVGPCIGLKSYEVDIKFYKKFISKSTKNKIYFLHTNIRRFADGEIYIEINENIRGNSVFVIQSTSNPANDNLMELLLVIDALKRSSAKTITAVIPYFGYARQDRKVAPRTSISAKVVANLLTNAGANRIVTVDLHAGQIQGFFDMPVDNLFTTPLFSKFIKKKNYFKKFNLCFTRYGWCCQN